MNNISIVGIDLAKHVFQLHAVDDSGHKVFSKKVKRDQLRTVIANLPPCLVAMEACGSAHYWAREIRQLGHEAHLLPRRPSNRLFKAIKTMRVMPPVLRKRQPVRRHGAWR